MEGRELFIMKEGKPGNWTRVGAIRRFLLRFSIAGHGGMLRILVSPAGQLDRVIWKGGREILIKWFLYSTFPPVGESERGEGVILFFLWVQVLMRDYTQRWTHVCFQNEFGERYVTKSVLLIVSSHIIRISGIGEFSFDISPLFPIMTASQHDVKWHLSVLMGNPYGCTFYGLEGKARSEA